MIELRLKNIANIFNYNDDPPRLPSWLFVIELCLKYQENIIEVPLCHMNMLTEGSCIMP